jgi:hypothetical protein
MFFKYPKLQFPIFRDFQDLEFRYPGLRVFETSIFSAFRDFKFWGFSPRGFQTHFVLQTMTSEIPTHSTLRVHITFVTHYHGGTWQVHEVPRRFQRCHQAPPFLLLFSSPLAHGTTPHVHMAQLPIDALGVGVSCSPTT